ncbi:MAG: prepilin peptidase [Phycisphaerae bacterium]|nr:prepilin peptidase [Phycisphaerae bacterium]
MIEAPQPSGSASFLPAPIEPVHGGRLRVEDVWPWWLAGLGLSAAVASVIQILTDRRGSGLFVLVTCYLVSIAAAWIDSAMRRVPNVLTYPAIIFGLALNCLVVPLIGALDGELVLRWIGSPGAAQAAWGFLLCAGFGIISFISRGLGGGDVKLLAAIGALIGLSAVIPVLFNTLVIAAVVGVLNWAVRGELVSRIQVVSLGLLQFAATRRGIAKVYPFQPREAPFCLSLLLGMILSHFFAVHEYVLGFIR